MGGNGADVVSGFVRVAGGNEAFHFTLAQAPLHVNGGITLPEIKAGRRVAHARMRVLCNVSLTRILHSARCLWYVRSCS